MHEEVAGVFDGGWWPAAPAADDEREALSKGSSNGTLRDRKQHVPFYFCVHVFLKRPYSFNFSQCPPFSFQANLQAFKLLSPAHAVAVATWQNDQEELCPFTLTPQPWRWFTATSPLPPPPLSRCFPNNPLRLHFRPIHLPLPGLRLFRRCSRRLHIWRC